MKDSKSNNKYTKLKGCPCNRNCCTNPKPYIPHTCDDSCESVCEESFVTKCKTCKSECCCDL